MTRDDLWWFKECAEGATQEATGGDPRWVATARRLRVLYASKLIEIDLRNPADLAVLRQLRGDALDSREPS